MTTVTGPFTTAETQTGVRAAAHAHLSGWLHARAALATCFGCARVALPWSAAVLTLVMAAFGADARWGLPGWARMSIAAAVIACVCCVLARAAVAMARAGARAAPDRAAVDAERHLGLAGNPLVNGAQLAPLAGLHDQRAVPRDCALRALLAGAEVTRSASPVAAAGWRRARRPLLLALAALAVIGATAVAAPRVVLTGAARFAAPFGDTPPWSPTALRLHAEPAELLIGDDVALTARVSGLTPRAVDLEGERPDGSVFVIPMTEHPDEPRTFVAKLSGVRDPVSLRAICPTGASRPLRLEPIDVPRVQRMDLLITRPGGACIPIDAVTRHAPGAGAAVEVVSGGSLAVTVHATSDLGGLGVLGAPPFTVVTIGRSATATFADPPVGEYTIGFVPRSVAGDEGPAGWGLSLVVRADEPPAVTLTPRFDALGRLELRCSATDDVGVRRLEVVIDPRDAGGLGKVRTLPVAVPACPEKRINASPAVDPSRLGVNRDRTVTLTACAVEAAGADGSAGRRVCTDPVVLLVNAEGVFECRSVAPDGSPGDLLCSGGLCPGGSGGDSGGDSGGGSGGPSGGDSGGGSGGRSGGDSGGGSGGGADSAGGARAGSPSGDSSGGRSGGTSGGRSGGSSEGGGGGGGEATSGDGSEGGGDTAAGTADPQTRPADSSDESDSDGGTPIQRPVASSGGQSRANDASVLQPETAAIGGTRQRAQRILGEPGEPASLGESPQDSWDPELLRLLSARYRDAAAEYLWSMLADDPPEDPR